MRTPLIASLFLAAAAVAGAADEQCGSCHPESRVAYEASVHADEEVTCTSCHGGDPNTKDVDAAHRGNGYRPLTDRREIPKFCGDCHSRTDMMRPYNLPVDQYAVYQTSQHGLALLRGDERVAVCTDCHGSHEIRSAADPQSSVHSKRLAETCGRCHADAALTAEYGMDGGVVADYQTGVHGVAVQEGSSSAPSCVDCHGAHGATPPGIGDIDKVCGACHVDVRAAFRAGTHHDALRLADLPECASCHQQHAVTGFGVEDLEPLCGDCHDADSEEYAVAAALQENFAEAREQIEAAEEKTLEAQRAAIHVEDHLTRIEEAKTFYREGESLVHSISLEVVDTATRRARSIGEEVQRELEEKLDRTNTYVGLAFFWFYIFVTLVVLYTYKRRYARPASQ